MFQESPFSGACPWATYEVIVMLAGTFLLGMLLGYLIWGWLKGKVTTLEGKLKLSQSIANAKEAKNVSLLTRTAVLEEMNQKLETKISLAEYRLRKSQEDTEALRNEMDKRSADESGDSDEPATSRTWDASDEPTLADITQAMEQRGDTSAKSDMPGTEAIIPASLRRGDTAESLEVAAQVFERTIRANDLKLIRGIGPKIEEVLYRAGLRSWAELAMIKLPDLRMILEEAGPRYRSFDPKTWSVQARMAARGEWRKLKAYQDTLTELGE